MTDFVLPASEERGEMLRRMTVFASRLDTARRWRWTCVEDRDDRSSQQNRYLNGIAYKALSDATGYTRDDISEYCCGRYWGWKTERCPKTPSNPNGVHDLPVRTTTRNELGKREVLSKPEFSKYVEFVQGFGAQHGVYIPDPEKEAADEGENDQTAHDRSAKTD